MYKLYLYETSGWQGCNLTKRAPGGLELMTSRSEKNQCEKKTINLEIVGKSIKNGAKNAKTLMPKNEAIQRYALLKFFLL